MDSARDWNTLGNKRTSNYTNYKTHTTLEPTRGSNQMKEEDSPTNNEFLQQYYDYLSKNTFSTTQEEEKPQEP